MKVLINKEALNFMLKQQWEKCNVSFVMIGELHIYMMQLSSLYTYTKHVPGC